MLSQLKRKYMDISQIQIQIGWLKLATDLLTAINECKSNQILHPEIADNLKKNEVDFTNQYNEVMDELLTYHINIENLINS